MSDKYRQTLQFLLPPGKAWTRELDAELTKLLAGEAVEHQRVEDRGVELLLEFDPDTTDELLEDWERVFDLPGDCSQPSTIAGRRQALKQKMLGFGDPNNAFWQEQAEALGFTFNSVESYQPMKVGFRAGDHVIGTNWTFGWVLWVDARTSEFNTLLQCTVESISPIHTVPVIYYQPFQDWSQRVPANLYSGFLTDATNDGVSRFLIVGESAEIETSDNGINWTQRTPAGAFAGDFFGAVGTTKDEFVIVGQSAEIQRTLNGGDSWAQETAGGGSTNTLYAVCSFDDQTQWAVGANGEIQFTDDGGSTWYQQTAGGGYTGTFFGVAVNDTGTMVVAAGTSGEIQYTKDGGSNWLQATPDESFSGYFSRAVFAHGHFWITGENGEIQHSKDGKQWHRVTNNYTDAIRAACSDGEGGMLFGDDGQEVHGWSQVGPERLFADLTIAAGSLDMRGLTVLNDVAVLCGQSGALFSADRRGS